MLRYNANSRLFKYTTEEKKRYKLYKRKKMWIVAGMSIFSTASLVQQASADETPLASTTISGDIKDDTSQPDIVANGNEVSEIKENDSSNQIVDSDRKSVV